MGGMHNPCIAFHSPHQTTVSLLMKLSCMPVPYHFYPSSLSFTANNIIPIDPPIKSAGNIRIFRLLMSPGGGPRAQQLEPAEVPSSPPQWERGLVLNRRSFSVNHRSLSSRRNSLSALCRKNLASPRRYLFAEANESGEVGKGGLFWRWQGQPEVRGYYAIQNLLGIRQDVLSR